MKNKTNQTKKWANEIKMVVVNGVKNYNNILTNKQTEILTEWMTANITQEDVAKKLNKHQTTISKSLFGNIDYKRQAVYGGIFKKIKKWETGNYTASKYKALVKNRP